MKRKSLFLAGLIALNGCAAADLGGDDGADKIVGGTNADITEFPWQISMQTTSGFHFCGGSILDAEWILTASHCVDGQSPSAFRIVAGVTRVSQSSSGQVRNVAQIIMFPGYVTPEQGKDVSLVRLSTPLTLNSTTVKAIPIVTAADASAGVTNPGVNSTVTGWGTLSSGGSSPDILQKVTVPLISNADANAAYQPEGITITADQLGAGLLGVGGRDSCQGDSGGPLVVQTASGTKLAGVVSWGFGCADANFPGMYARVSSFEQFITSRGGGGGGGTPEVLQNNVPRTNLSATQGTTKLFTLEVPAGATNLSFTISGGTGDADLYVRRGSAPTDTTFDCRPFLGGNNETCNFAAPVAGTYFVGVKAFSAFSGVTLLGRFTAPGGFPGIELQQTNISGAQNQFVNFQLNVPSGAARVIFQISGGTGDADLYVRRGSAPTTSTFDCRPFLNGNNETCTFNTPVSGTYFIGIRGFSAFSGVTLTGDIQ
jgi:secreted trypsin-like serine protease